MTNYVLITQAINDIPYKREHVSLLIRRGKVKGQKVGGVWLVDLDGLKEYYVRMESLGSKRHSTRK